MRAIIVAAALALLPALPATAQLLARPAPRIERAEPGAQTAPVSPLLRTPRPVLVPQGALRPDRLQVRVAGPMTLSVIDPGYVEDRPGTSRITDLVACVNDGNGNAGSVSAISYALSPPGGARSGTMDLPVLVPPNRPDVLKGMPTQSAGSVAGRRRARVELPSCGLPAGELDLAVRADGLTAQAKTIVAPIASTVYIQYVPATEIGRPVTIAGSAGSRCGTAAKAITLSAPGSAPVSVPVQANGQFSTPFTFRRAGSVRLTAAMAGDDDYAGAAATTDVSVAKIAMTASVAGLPGQARIGGSVPVAIQLRGTAGNQPLAGIPVAMKMTNAKGCSAVTGGDGIARCTIGIDANDAAIGSASVLSLDVADASPLAFAATNKVLLKSAWRWWTAGSRRRSPRSTSTSISNAAASRRRSARWGCRTSTTSSTRGCTTSSWSTRCCTHRREPGRTARAVAEDVEDRHADQHPLGRRGQSDGVGDPRRVIAGGGGGGVGGGGGAVSGPARASV